MVSLHLYPKAVLDFHSLHSRDEQDVLVAKLAGPIKGCNMYGY